MIDWQPIDTLPYDTTVLLCTDDMGVFVDFWYDESFESFVNYDSPIKIKWWAEINYPEE